MAYQDWKIPTGFDFIKEPIKDEQDKDEKSANTRSKTESTVATNTKYVRKNLGVLKSQLANLQKSVGAAHRKLTSNDKKMDIIDGKLNEIKTSNDKKMDIIDGKLDETNKKIDAVLNRISIKRGILKGKERNQDLEYARDPLTGVTKVTPVGENKWRFASKKGGIASEDWRITSSLSKSLHRKEEPNSITPTLATSPMGVSPELSPSAELDDNVLRPASDYQSKIARQQYEASETPIAELTVSTKKEFKRVNSKLDDMAVQLANLSNMLLLIGGALGLTSLAGGAAAAKAAQSARRGGLLKRAAGVLTRRATMIPMAIGGALLGSSLMSPEAMAGDMTGDESGKGGGFGMGETAIAGVGGYFMYRTIRNTATKYTTTAERKRMAEKAYKRYLKRVGAAVVAQNATKWQRFIVYLQAAKPALYRRVGMRLAAMGVLATIPVGGWIAAGISIGLNAMLIAELIGLWRSFESQTPEEQSMWDKFKAKLADIFLPEPAAASVPNPLTPEQQPSPAPTTTSPPGQQEQTESTESASEIGKKLGLSGIVTSPHGKRADPETGKPSMHHGLDFAGKEGDPVNAFADGKVILAKDDGGHGNRVILDHGEYRTSYSHLSAFDVKQGDTVKAGQVIGKIGSTGRSTGPHLHFEMGPEIIDQGKVVGYARRDPNQFVAEQAEKLAGTIKGSGTGGGGSMSENLTPVGRTSDLGAAGKQREQMVSGAPSVTVMQPIVQGGPTIMGGNSTPPQSLPRADLRPSDSVLTSFNRDRWALA